MQSCELHRLALSSLRGWERREIENSEIIIQNCSIFDGVILRQILSIIFLIFLIIFYTVQDSN